MSAARRSILRRVARQGRHKRVYSTPGQFEAVKQCTSSSCYSSLAHLSLLPPSIVRYYVLNGPRLISSSFSVLLSSQLRTMMSSSEPSSGPFQPVSNQYYKTMRQYQQLLDRITPFMLYRWLGTAALLAIFMLRIVLAQGVCPYFTFAFPCLGVLTISISGILVRTKV